MFASGRYQGQGQVITCYNICWMWLIVPALHTCFWHTSPKSSHRIIGILTKSSFRRAPIHYIMINSSPPSAAYMREWMGSALVQIMACAYWTPSHFLNQRWVIVNWILKNKFQWKFNQSAKHFVHENASDNIICEMAAILSMGRWVNGIEICHIQTWSVL